MRRERGREVGTSGAVCVITEAVPPYTVVVYHCVGTLSLRRQALDLQFHGDSGIQERNQGRQQLPGRALDHHARHQRAHGLVLQPHHAEAAVGGERVPGAAEIS